MCGNTAHCSTQPRYRKGGTRIFFFQVCNTTSLQFAESRPQRRMYSYTHLFVLFQTLCLIRRKQMLQRVPSPFSIRSRHNLHSSSGTGARVHQGLGSRGNVRITEPRESAVEAASSIVLTVSLPVSSPLCSYAVKFDGFPPFYEALL